MRILGVDPGSRITGYGVIDKVGSRLIHVDCGILAPPPKASLPERLLFIAEGLEKVIREFSPEISAMENVFYAKNWKSALTLGQARGASLCALARCGLTVQEYPPASVKLAVAGYGRAEKEQIQQMIRILLGLPDIPEENAADALAVAVCHAQDNSHTLKELLK